MRRVDPLRLGQPERVLLLLIFLFQVLLRARRFSISTSVLRESRISIYFDFRPDDMHADLVLGMVSILPNVGFLFRSPFIHLF